MVLPWMKLLPEDREIIRTAIQRLLNFMLWYVYGKRIESVRKNTDFQILE